MTLWVLISNFYQGCSSLFIACYHYYYFFFILVGIDFIKCFSVSVESESHCCVPWTVAFWAPLYKEFSRQDTGVASHSLLQGVFPTQGSKPGLPHCRQILYCLSHQRSPNWDNHIISPLLMSHITIKYFLVSIFWWCSLPSWLWYIILMYFIVYSVILLHN